MGLQPQQRVVLPAGRAAGLRPPRDEDKVSCFAAITFLYSVKKRGKVPYFSCVRLDAEFPGEEVREMKRIDAIIRPNNLEAVKEHLVTIGIEGLTVSEVRGFGRQRGHTEIYRGTEYSVDFVPKIMITILVTEDRAAAVLDAITAGARTGKMGDGKIFVTPLEEVVRIRNGDRGDSAI
jgi:nitrogen regulatory protein PII